MIRVFAGKMQIRTDKQVVKKYADKYMFIMKRVSLKMKKPFFKSLGSQAIRVFKFSI